MLNHLASPAMSTSLLKALPGRLDIKRQSSSIFFLFYCRYLKSDRVVILINLCLALTVSYIIFLSGVDRTENKVN